MAPNSRAARAVLLAAALACAAAAEPGCGPDGVCVPEDVEAVDEASLVQRRGKLNETGLTHRQARSGRLDRALSGKDLPGDDDFDLFGRRWERRQGYKINPAYDKRRVCGDALYGSNSAVERALEICAREISGCRGFSVNVDDYEDDCALAWFGINRGGTPSWSQCCESESSYWVTWLMLESVR